MSNDTCSAPECMNDRAPKPPTGPRSPYCSKACRNRASYLLHRESRLAANRAETVASHLPKVCPQCSQTFTPERTNKQRFCSRPCGADFHRDSSGKFCTNESCDRQMRAKGLCATHYAATRPKAQGRPETRRANLRRKTQLRRARLQDSEAEPVDRDVVGDRDGWKCGLCGHRVDNSLSWPHPRSASLDHIVPLSKGGAHAYINTQIAHLDCNMAKGNRGGGEQLLLIG